MNFYLEIDDYISLVGNNGNGFSIEIQTGSFLVLLGTIILLRLSYKLYKKKRAEHLSQGEEAQLNALLGVVAAKRTFTHWEDGWDKDKKDRSCGCD